MNNNNKDNIKKWITLQRKLRTDKLLFDYGNKFNILFYFNLELKNLNFFNDEIANRLKIFYNLKHNYELFLFKENKLNNFVRKINE